MEGANVVVAFVLSASIAYFRSSPVGELATTERSWGQPPAPSPASGSKRIVFNSQSVDPSRFSA